ncbi:MAG TPA: hypothetical protein V6C57_07170 [Coleofasciculaceae cyanobacterium]
MSFLQKRSSLPIWRAILADSAAIAPQVLPLPVAAICSGRLTRMLRIAN